MLCKKSVSRGLYVFKFAGSAIKRQKIFDFCGSDDVFVLEKRTWLRGPICVDKKISLH